IGLVVGGTALGLFLAADALVFGTARRLGRVGRRLWWRWNALSVQWPRAAARSRPARADVPDVVEPPAPAATADVPVTSVAGVPIHHPEAPSAEPVEAFELPPLSLLD